MKGLAMKKYFNCSRFYRVVSLSAFLLATPAFAEINIGDFVCAPLRDGSFEVAKIKASSNGVVYVESLGGVERSIKSQDVKDLNPLGSVDHLMGRSKADRIEAEAFLFGRLGKPGKWQTYLSQERERMPEGEKRAWRMVEDIRASWPKAKTGMPLVDARLDLESMIRVAENNLETQAALPVLKRDLEKLEDLSQGLKVARESALKRMKEIDDKATDEATQLMVKSDKLHQTLRTASVNAEQMKKEAEQAYDKMWKRTGIASDSTPKSPAVSRSVAQATPRSEPVSRPTLSSKASAPAPSVKASAAATKRAAEMPLPPPPPPAPASDETLLDSVEQK